MLDADLDTLPKLVLRNAGNAPRSVAMRRKTLGVWQRVLWSEVAERMHGIAAGLLASGLDGQVAIAIIGDNSPELFWAEYAIQATGRAAVCLYPEITGDELVHNLEDCGAAIAFAEDQEQCDKLLAVADAVGLRLIVCWDDRGMAGYDDPRLVSLAELQKRGAALLRQRPGAVDDLIAGGSADDLAVVIYTSGTTGTPKGVMGSHRYLLDCARRWGSVLEARPGSNYVSYISPAWATEQYLGLAMGVSLPLVVNFPEEPDTVNADLREIGAEFLFFSPRQWESIVSSTQAKMQDASAGVRGLYRWAMATLAETPGGSAGLAGRLKRGVADLLVGRAVRDRLGFTYLRTAVNSGSSLSPEVFGFFQALGVSLRNVYGFTEVGIVTATGDADPRDTVGRTLTSDLGETPLEVRVREDEIQVRGGVLFDGYFNRPDATKQRFTDDGWMRSGDAGRFDDAGRLVYLDRLEDMRRLGGGETFAPQHVETRIRLSPYIRDVIVVGEGQRAPAALIDIDMDMVGKWAEERRIGFTSQFDLSQQADIYALVESELRSINSTLPVHCRIWKFANLFKPLDADEGELTRSRKLRRAVVETKYAELIGALYGDAPTAHASIEVKLQDGRSRRIASAVRIAAVDGAEPPSPESSRPAPRRQTA